MVALTPSGQRIVAWEQLQTGSSNPQGIAVRIAPPGGDFGPTQLFADPNEFDPSLRAGADGTVALVWDSHDGLHIARLAPGASSFAQAASLPLGAPVREAPDVAVQGGDVYVALATENQATHLTSTAIEVVHLAAGTLGPELLPGAAGGALDSASFDSTSQPDSTVDAPRITVQAGTIHVVWDLLNDAPAGQTNSFTTVRRATRSVSGGNFSAPIPVDTFPTAFVRPDDAEQQIASGAGRVDIAWVRGEQEQVVYQELTAGTGVETAAANVFASSLHAGVDNTGALLLGWRQFSVSDSVEGVFASVVPPGGPAGPEIRLTPPNANRNLDDFVVGPDGTAFALPDRVNDDPFGNADEQASEQQLVSGRHQRRRIPCGIHQHGNESRCRRSRWSEAALRPRPEHEYAHVGVGPAGHEPAARQRRRAVAEPDRDAGGVRAVQPAVRIRYDRLLTSVRT
jgi:hypothetical protein